MKTKLTLLVLVTTVCAFAQAPMPNVPPKRTRAIAVAWDASPTPGVTYRLRRGVAAGKYDEMVNLAVGTLTYTWTNAPSLSTNYFVVTAVLSGVTNGVAWEEESVYSNEVFSTPREVQAPVARMAVPIMVEIYRREPGKLWAKALTFGPFLDRVDHPAEEFSAVLRVGKPMEELPE